MKKAFRLFILFLALFPWGIAGAAAYYYFFEDRVSYETDKYPLDLAAADINGDGFIDIVYSPPMEMPGERC